MTQGINGAVNFTDAKNEKVAADAKAFNTNFEGATKTPAKKYNLWKELVEDTRKRCWARIRNFSLARAINNLMTSVTRIAVIVIAAIMVYNFIQANPEAWASIVAWAEGLWDSVISFPPISWFISIFA